MMGMEMMLAKMIGKTPEEMRAVADQVSRAVIEGAESMAAIREQNVAILERLERIENGNGKPKRN